MARKHPDRTSLLIPLILCSFLFMTKAAGDDLLEPSGKREVTLGASESGGSPKPSHPADFDIPLPSDYSDFDGYGDLPVKENTTSRDESDDFVLELDRKVSSMEQGVYLFTLKSDLTDSEFVYLEVRGVGMLHLSFPDTPAEAEGEATRVYNLPIDVVDETAKIPFLDQKLRKKGRTLKVELTGDSNYLSLTVKKAVHFEVEFNQSCRVINLADADLRFRVTLPADTKVTDDSRIQFIISSSLEDQVLAGNERLDMFINKGLTFPTAGSHDTKSSAILGSGLIKTITKGDDYFCDGSTCQYSVTVATKNVKEISFFPSMLAQKAPVNFKRMVSLLEELEPAKSVEYEFDVVGTKDTWVLSILPFEGSVELFVNEDAATQIPESAQHYAYSTRREELIITAREETAGSATKPTKKFWVKFRNPDDRRPTTFQFKMRRVSVGYPLEIAENSSENGSLVKGEVLSLMLNKRQEAEELIKLELRLEVLSGSAEMILKSCYLPHIPCEVTAADFQANVESENTFVDENAVMRISKWNPASKAHYISQFVRCVSHEVWENATINFGSNFPISATCTFAIGIRSTESRDDSRTRFKFVAYGHGALTPITLSEAALVKVAPKEQKRFEVNAGEPVKAGLEKVLEVRVVSLTGSCMVYLSTTTKVPSETDHDASILIENAGSIRLKTQTFKEQISFGHRNETTDDMLYVTVEGISFATVDVTPIVLYGQGDHPSWERLVENRLLHRQITEQEFGSQIDRKTGDKVKVYSQKFVYALDQRLASLGNSAEMHFVVDSQTVGLRICLQEFSGRNIPFDDCQFVSSGTHLTVDKAAVFKKGADSILVVIQKVVPEQTFVRLPIDFALKLTTAEDFTPTELVRPGHSHTSKLHRGASQEFFIDLKPINSLVTLMFESSDPEMTASVQIESLQGRWSVGQLDMDNFALEIKSLSSLKQTNCTTVCNLFISVYTPSKLTERFTLTYQRDDVSLILKEGEQLSFPNNRPTLFAFETDGTEPISFSVHNDHVESAIMAKLVDPSKILVPMMLIYEISSSKFDFKTNIETDPEITVPTTALKPKEPNGLVFFVRPVFKAEPLSKESIVFFNHKTRGRVHLHAKLLKLKPFYQTKFKVSQADTKYFQIDLDSQEDFSVILSLESGLAQMFLNHGDGNLPTPKKFWRKSTSLNGDEIVITKAELIKEAGGSSQFFLGVTGLEASKFGLLLLPAFKNLIKVSFQHLIDLKLEEGKNYYFDYLNTHEKYATLFSAEGSDVEVSALNYDKEETDFVTMTTDEKNYHQKFTIKRGDIPRQRFFNKAADARSTTVVRVKALKGNARLNFAIYDADKPLEVFTEKRFKFTQDADQTVYFSSNLGETYDEMEVHFRLDSGSVKFSMSQNLNLPGAEVVLAEPSERSINFRVNNLAQSSDIMIFNQFFLTVQSSKFSRYSILLLPKDKFRQIKAFEPEIIQASTTKDVYVYFYLSSRMAQSTHNIILEVTRPEGFSERPDMLFVAESDVVLNSDSPYLPMPVNDVFERRSGDFVHFEIHPETHVGYYVLRFGQAEFEFPIKVSVSYNDMRNIEVNALQKGAIPESLGKSHEYSMFVAEPGEVRIMLESCNDLSIKEGRFYGEEKQVPVSNQEDRNEYSFDEKTKITEIKFDQSFMQSSPYLKLTTSRFAKSAVPMELASRIVRAFFSSPGILKFKVVRSARPLETEADDADKKWWLFVPPERDPTYVMQTEFRPNNIELIMKDYVQLFESSEDLKNLKLGHRHSRATGEVLLTVRVPHFKPQLLIDYPEIQFAVIKFSFFVFADETFQSRLLDCGTACLDSIEHSVTVHTVNMDREAIQNMYSNNYVEVTIPPKALEVLNGSRTMSVFCLLSVRWYNNKDDVNQISLNPKHTHVPYFHVTFPYREHSGLYIFLAVGLAVSILAFAVWTWGQKSRRRMVVREYHSPNVTIQTRSSGSGSDGDRSQNTSRDSNRSGMELSSISRADWRDDRL